MEKSRDLIGDYSCSRLKVKVSAGTMCPPAPGRIGLTVSGKKNPEHQKMSECPPLDMSCAINYSDWFPANNSWRGSADYKNVPFTCRTYKQTHTPPWYKGKEVVGTTPWV